MSTPPVVAVIHATPATMGPVSSAFDETYPAADLWHLVDDRLVSDAERAGGLTAPLHTRMATLIQYAVDGGADAVQLACSMYGPVASATTYPIPVRASDQAMFDEVARLRPGHVTILASLVPAAADSEHRLRESLAAAGLEPKLTSVVVPEARTASANGDLDGLVRALAEASRGLGSTDVIVLAQYTLAPVATRLRDTLDVPVLSGPHLAASRLAAALGDDGA